MRLNPRTGPSYTRILSKEADADRRVTATGWLLGAIALGLLLALLIAALAGRRRALPAPGPVPPAARPVAAPPAPRPWADLRYPTEQDLLDGGLGAFQPTASGNPESALFGSTRTAQRGGRLGPSFHEGVDIASRRRDARGQPQDVVGAIAKGRVVYVNRSGGNSTYGQYVVLAHDDRIGEVYSLYAHLAEVWAGIWPGKDLAPGEPLGRMGNTASTGIPLARAHLHLETALLANRRFDAWFRAHKLTSDHGPYNGWNLLAFDPLALYRARRERPDAGVADVLARAPRAFDLALRTAAPLDFFERYPALWRGPAAAGQPIVMSCAENGLPLAGRRATPAEAAALGRESCRVLQVDEAALGRNGCRLIARSSRGWVLTESGQRWLEILTYAPGALPVGYAGK